MSEIFSRIIKQIRLEHGYTQEQLATTIGKSLSAIKKWECGERIPRPQTLLELTKLFKIDIIYLLNDSFNDSYLFKIPIYTGNNAKTLFADEQIMNTIAFPESLIADSFKYFGIPIVDSSLINEGLKKGDIAIFQKCGTKDIKPGEIGLFTFEDSVYCRVFNKNKNSIELISYNTDYKTISSNDIEIIGKLYLTIKKQTYINTRS